MKVKNLLVLGFGILLLLIAATSLLGIARLNMISTEIVAVSQDHLPRAAAANHISDHVNETARTVRTALLTPDVTLAAQQVKAAEDAMVAIETEFAKLKQYPATTDAQSLEAAMRQSDQSYRADLQHFSQLFKAGQAEEAKSFLLSRLRPSQLAYQSSIEKLVGYEEGQAETRAAGMRQAADNTLQMTMMLLAASLLAGVLAAWLIGRSLFRTLGCEPSVAAQVMKELSSGSLETNLQLAAGDNSSLAFFMKQAADKAVDNILVRNALDVAATNIMIADANGVVVYANSAVQGMLANAEADIRKELPNFSARGVVGSNIDGFHKHPDYQRKLLANLRGTHRAQIEVGGRTFVLLVNPIDNGKGKTLGMVVEWQDITEQLKLQAQEQDKRQEELRQMAENTRIRKALDNVTTNVMIADADRTIIYMNRSVQDMLRNAEADIRQVLSNFDSRTLLGTSMDGFHRNPAHQRELLASLQQTYTANIVVGKRSFRLIANPVVSDAGERLGSVVEWADITDRLQAEREEQQRREDEQKMLAENTRIRKALDNVSSNVMIADNERTIIYMNRSVQEMLRNAEADIKKALPNFDSHHLLGTNMDGFHRNPAHQRELLASLKQTYTAQIVVGGRTFRLTANPVFSDGGERLGSVVEWADRTDEVRVEQEVSDIVGAAVRGDFLQRIPMHGKSGFFASLSEQINQLMEVSNQGLSDVATVLGALAKGDLTRTIAADYQGMFGQLKTDTNQTVQRLREIVGNIQDAASAINTAAREISAGNSNLSSRTEQQAASLEETASSMEEITSTVKQNADNSRRANSLAVGASDIASRGGVVVGQVVSTMNEINQSATKIVDIISVIDGIAFQTNILALNAAVEAARAGEQGRGFAVVASEVRNLAQRSAAAAKEIKGLIGDSVDKVESGSRLVDEAGRTMEEIVTSIRRVADIMSEISSASIEQSSGIEQVNLAVSQMDENTQKNAALVEEAAAAAESLEEQAGVLLDAVSIFHLDSSARAARPATNHVASAAAPVARQAIVLPKPAGAQAPAVVRNHAPAVHSPLHPVPSDEGEWEEF
ncbi:methyl-accepting chemotaxis protein [Vogesella sp. LIG4]|uniref:methyl-accepting chemotaxis protein n=1 Tax=Vogesella sp. LIG4 TaxID=1192162 RepID=UPI0008201CC2|nr:methyl-accepting chemotaxis protein [Vogesella sp. LIG4]